MHRLILLSAMLAVMTLGGCTGAGNANRSDDLYRAQMDQRRNPSPTAGW